MLLQATEAVEAITKYDDSDIVKGIIICFVLMMAFITIAGVVYVKFFQTKFDLSKLPPVKINISALDAMEITHAMVEKIFKIPINGVSAEKRASDLQHKTNEALANNSDIATLIVELIDTMGKLVTSVQSMDSNMSSFYKSQGGKTDKLNDTILEFVLKKTV